MLRLAMYWYQPFLSFLLLILGVSTPLLAEERPKDFGKQWVRSHLFRIGAVVQLGSEVAGDDRFSQADLNTMLIWKRRPELFAAAQRQRLNWILHVDPKRQGRLTEEQRASVKQVFSEHAGGVGILCWDEPTRPEMSLLAEAIAYFQQTYPDRLVYSNLYSLLPDDETAVKQYGGKSLGNNVYDYPPVPYTFENYLDEYVETCKPDVLSVDIYPFITPPSNEPRWDKQRADPQWFLLNRYFQVLAFVRKAALRTNIPYWTFIQAFDFRERRLPSESEVRMQVYSSLAFGFTGIDYFTYGPGSFARAMLDRQPDDVHVRGPLYDVVARLNQEVLRLGASLRFLTSTDVRYVQGRPRLDGPFVANRLPVGLGAFHRESRVAQHVQGITIETPGVEANALIGFFEDDKHSSYFMVVNLNHGPELDAEAARVTITIELAPSVSALAKLSRQTGKPEAVAIAQQQIKVQLPGGTGELFKIGDTQFPGLEQKDR